MPLAVGDPQVCRKVRDSPLSGSKAQIYHGGLMLAPKEPLLQNPGAGFSGAPCIRLVPAK